MKQKFTIQLRGYVTADDQVTLQQQMQEVLATFPQFSLVYSSVELWSDINGKPRKFNDDGTEYQEIVESTQTEDPADQPEDLTTD